MVRGPVRGAAQGRRGGRRARCWPSTRGWSDGGEPLQAALHAAFVGALASIHPVATGGQRRARRRGGPVAAVPRLGRRRFARPAAGRRRGLGGDRPAGGRAAAVAHVGRRPPGQPAGRRGVGRRRRHPRLGAGRRRAGRARPGVVPRPRRAPGPVRRLDAAGLPRPGRATLAAWSAAVGRPAVDVAWHEVFALVRSTAIHDHQSRLAVAAGDEPASVSGADNPCVRYLTKKIERFDPDPRRPACRIAQPWCARSCRGFALGGPGVACAGAGSDPAAVLDEVDLPEDLVEQGAGVDGDVALGVLRRDARRQRGEDAHGVGWQNCTTE